MVDDVERGAAERISGIPRERRQVDPPTISCPRNDRVISRKLGESSRMLEKLGESQRNMENV